MSMGAKCGRLVRALCLAAGAAFALCVLGFAWFLWLANSAVPNARRVDAIVALTGGPGRVEVALRLLANGTADRLLVSGAGEKTELAALAHRAGIDPAPVEREITLGRAAHSTRGNALETASWANEQGVGTLLVVTTWFHMPRALVEMHRTMPAVAAAPYPVGRLSVAELMRHGMARRVIGEYFKYLAALAGITALPLGAAPQEMEMHG